MNGRREQLIDAAEQVFARQGYAATTMADIAKEAGVTRPTVYAYFDSKHDALRAVTERVQCDFVALQDQSGDTPAVTLELTLRAYLREFVRHYGVLTVMTHQALGDPEFAEWLDAIHTRTNKRHAKYLRRLVESGEAAPLVPPEIVAEVITGSALRFAQLIIEDPSREAELTRRLHATHVHLAGVAVPARVT